LLAYSLYSLIRPTLKIERSGLPAELGVGTVNGLIGGLTGLGGVAITIWCQLRGEPKDVQRAIFQPVLLTTFAMSAVSYGIAGRYTAETLKFYAFTLPLLIVGVWSGIQLYGKLDDAGFRKVILLLILVCGLSLVVPDIVLR